MNRWVQGPRGRRYLGAFILFSFTSPLLFYFPTIGTLTILAIMIIDAKRQLRKEKRQLRHSLSDRQQQQAGQKLLRQLRHLPEYRYAKRIAGYIANDGEISLAQLFRHARLNHKSSYLPVVSAAGDMQFYRYFPGQFLRSNLFGIGEPSRRQPSQDVSELDIIFLPLVAFDRRGGRLGMGGGFYDRALQQSRRQKKRPLLIGLAHSLQETETVPLDSWDIPLHLVVTEREILRCRR